jgi:hypothetical protein
VIFNSVDINATAGRVFLLGNLHPAFSSNWALQSVGSTTAGSNKVTLASGSASGFNVGDQIAVCSNEVNSGAYDYYRYLWLATIESIAGATLTLSETVDKAVAAGIVVVSSVNGRDSVPLFFAHNVTVSDLTIKAKRKWVSDSAMLRCNFYRCSFDNDVGVYGNIFQHTVFRDCDFTVKISGGELSHNSYHAYVDRCRFRYVEDTAVTPSQGFSFQEFTRYCGIGNSEIDAGSVNLDGLFIFTTRSVEYCSIKNIKFNHYRLSSTATVLYISNSTVAATTPSEGNNVFSRIDSDVLSCRRHLLVEDPAPGNVVDSCAFNGVAAQIEDSCRISIGALRLQNCYLEGKFTFQAGTSQSTLINNHITNGIVNTSGLVAVQHLLENNYSDEFLRKRSALKTVNFSTPGVGAGATGTFFSAALNSELVIGDIIELSVSGNAGGTNGDRTLTLNIQLDGGASFAAGAITIPAANFGRYSGIITLTIVPNGYVVFDGRLGVSGGTLFVATNNYVATSVLNKNATLTLDGTCAGTNTALTCTTFANLRSVLY